MDRDGDGGAEAGQSLVDGVVDDLVDEVVQSALAGRADVHAGAQADRLEPFENGDVLCVVVGVATRGVVSQKGPPNTWLCPGRHRVEAAPGHVESVYRTIAHRGAVTAPGGPRKRLLISRI